MANIANTIGASPFWDSTVIFVTWDDWGGWYDHVSPPQVDNRGLGSDHFLQEDPSGQPDDD